MKLLKIIKIICSDPRKTDHIYFSENSEKYRIALAIVNHVVKVSIYSGMDLMTVCIAVLNKLEKDQNETTK